VESQVRESYANSCCLLFGILLNEVTTFVISVTSSEVLPAF
jgi:hypothetical protein